MQTEDKRHLSTMIEMGFEEGTTIIDPGYQNVKNLFLNTLFIFYPVIMMVWFLFNWSFFTQKWKMCQSIHIRIVIQNNIFSECIAENSLKILYNSFILELKRGTIMFVCTWFLELCPFDQKWKIVNQVMSELPYEIIFFLNIWLI